MPTKPRRSLTLLASVFQSSQSEDSNTACNTAPSTPSSEDRSFSSDSSVEIPFMSREPTYYDDLQSLNIDALSVSFASATVEETSLLDSDPFADLSAPPMTSPPPTESSSLSLQRPPKSPLSPSGSTSRSRSATFVQSTARPAYQKRPIHSSPSMPTLSTLAATTVKIPKKVRKGNVGARLPSEPWDLLASVSSPDSSLPHSSSEEDEEDYGNLCSRLSVVDEHSGLGDRLSDEFKFSDVDNSFSPKPSSPIPIKAFNDEAPIRSRSSSISSGSSYGLEPMDWFSQAGHTSADFDLHSPSITPLHSSSSQTSFSDAYLLSCSSSSSGSDHSDQSLDPMDTSSYPHQFPLLSLPKFSLSLELPTGPEQLGEEEFSALSSSPCQAVRERIHSPYHEEAINMNALHVSDPLDEAAQFEPGSSASTIRASPLKNNSLAGTQKSTRSQSRHRRGVLSADMWIRGGNIGDSCEEPAVDGDYPRGRSTSAGGMSSGYAGNNGGGYSGRAYSTGGFGMSGSGAYGSGGHGGDDDDDGNKRNRRFMPGSFAAFSNESDEDEQESDDEDDYGMPSGLPSAQNRSQSDDDDVPLARSIPTALKAQQSIRMKDREARDKRRKEREVRAAARSQQRHHQQATVRSPPVSSTQDSALQASRSLRRPINLTTQTPQSPFAIDDLTKKLENMQARGPPDSRPIPLSVGGTPRSDAFSPKDVVSAAPVARTLRPMRSFHKPEPKKTTDEPISHPIPAGPEAKLSRSTTRARARSTTSREHQSGSTASQPRTTAADESDTAKLERKRTVKTADGARSARTSTEQSRPPPPLPAPADIIARQNNAKFTLTQQRVFIGDRQRFVVVEVGHSTTAGDVVSMVEAQGALKEWRGSGGWMLFEIAQDFGMERPIRSFELLSDVETSWNKDKLVNVFLLKLTPLASILSRSALPSSSPTHSGYVEWESKRGKWNKRYLMLKEHSLWLSKRDNGRDETMLCSLSNFDAYQITRLVRAPKDFTFAVKSTDNLSFFENTADYLHIFSCKTDAGEKWMEKILLARSYILHQERHILSSKAHPKSPPPQTGSTGLSRSVTKRNGPTLVNVNPTNVFEPGSLLRG